MADTQTLPFSIELPAKKEASSLQHLLPELKNAHPEAEIIVVNDDSTNDTEEVCEKYWGKIGMSLTQGNKPM